MAFVGQSQTILTQPQALVTIPCYLLLSYSIYDDALNSLAQLVIVLTPSLVFSFLTAQYRISVVADT
jgi:hypothetical protein